MEYETIPYSSSHSHPFNCSHNILVSTSKTKKYQIVRVFLSNYVKGLIVALIYTLINSEVQSEIFRSLDRCFMQNNAGWQQPNFFRNYMNKLDRERLYSLGYQARSTPVKYRPQIHTNGVVQYYRCTNQHKYSLSNPSRQDSIRTAASLAQELALLNLNLNR